jgi:small conductance mechanosensitive channel
VTDLPIPEVVLEILAVILISVAVRVVVALAIRSITKATNKRTEQREGKRPGRAARLMRLASQASSERHRQRTQAMASLMRSITNVVVVAVALVTIIAILGIPVAPLIAATGVGGVALGFGAQSLVKDFLSGIAIIVEDQYGVGDYIDTGDVAGTVEEITLRTTRLRNAYGEIWYLRNGEILKVRNVSQGWSTARVNVPVSPTADVDKALEVLRQVAKSTDKNTPWKKLMLERPTVDGISGVTAEAVTILMTVKTLPAKNAEVERNLLTRALAALREAEIPGPTPIVLDIPPS